MIFRRVAPPLLAIALLWSAPASAQNSGPVDLAATRGRAEQGDVEAANLLGNLYTNGQGVPRDYAEALKWYQRAAEKGFAPAQFNLGLAHELGRGVPADEPQAFRHYLLAAEQGFPAAQFNVGNMYATGRGVKQDLFEANLWFKQAADKGIVEAQFNLGLAYEEGRGVKKDDAQAVKWYRLAAERGFARAQYNLGLLLEDGRGAEKNLNAAAALYQQAALAGHAPAMNNLGLMYSQGRGGLPTDPVLAYAWLSLAVENGIAPAARDFVGEDLTPEQRSGAGALAVDLKRRVVRSSGPVAAARPPAAPDTGARETAEALAEARAANSRFAETNQRLELENAQLQQKLAQETEAARTLVENLRRQSERLQSRVQEAVGEKTAAEQNVAVLGAQLRDVQSELLRARESAGLARVPDEITAQLRQLQEENRRLQAARDSAAEETAALTRQLGSLQVEADRLRTARSEVVPAADVARLETRVTELQQVNARLEKELQAARTQPAALDAVGSGKVATTDSEKDNIIRNLQRDNQRLNDDVKRSTRELLALNQQLRGARNRATENESGSASNEATARELADLRTAHARLQEQADEARSAVGRLEQDLQAARNALAGQEDSQTQLTASRRELADVRAGREQLAATLATATQRVESLEGELAAARRTAAPAVDAAALQRQLDETNERAVALRAELEKVQGENAGLAAQVESAKEDVAVIRGRLAEAQAGAGEADSLRRQVAELSTTLEQRTRELAESRQAAGAKPAVDPAELEQLREENRRLQAAASDAEGLRTQITQLEREKAELQAAGRERASPRELRAALARAEDLQTKLSEATAAIDRQSRTAAELTLANEKLKQDLEAARTPRVSASSTADRRELEAARAQIEDLQGQVAQLQAGAAAKGDDRKLQAELAEAHEAAERSAAAVAELTGANERLQKDLDNAQKSLAAALAAQTQAVDASKGEAYQLEIQTLTNRVKQLEGVLEEGQAGAAKEISSLAAQLAKTRETNRALVEANRALLQSKEAEKSFEADELAQAQQKLREATGAAAATTETNRRLTAELASARQELDKANELAAGSTALAEENRMIRARLAEFERAAETSGSAVAELTGTNVKLEQELGGLRQQVDRLQAENARLTQDLRSTTQTANAAGSQLAALRRDVENARAANATLVESTAAQDRERTALITQLREENRALTVRLSQAQGVLDQIASAARLGTPASSIAGGNTAAQTRTVAVVSTPVEAAPRVHTVTEGDSLSRISLRYYGTAARWQEIFEANRDVLQGANALRVGQQLRIP